MFIRQANTQRQTGFTLMEAMVSLLIFSVGLLGLAGMQLSGLQQNHNSLSRTIAIQSAYDMADIVRSYGGSTPPTTVPFGAQFEWNFNLRNNLYSGRGTVVMTNPATGASTVTVFWDEDRTGATRAVNCPPLNANDLRCFQLTVIP